MSFINQKKITEALNITEGIEPTTSDASSAELVDMQDFGKFVSVVSQGSATTAGNLVVTLYESTASTWDGAVATQITASITTTSVDTDSSGIASVEVDESALSSGMRYVGTYAEKDDDDSALSAAHVRGNGRYQ